MKSTTKYFIAAGLGVCLCVGLGFAMGSASAENKLQTVSSDVLNKENFEEKDFSSEEFTEKERPSAGMREEMSAHIIERIQEGFAVLSSEDQKTVLSILDLTESDVENLTEEKLEEVQEKIEGLDEEEKETLMEIFSSLKNENEGFSQGESMPKEKNNTFVDGEESDEFETRKKSKSSSSAPSQEQDDTDTKSSATL
jgi:hypothetical protein